MKLETITLKIDTKLYEEAKTIFEKEGYCEKSSKMYNFSPENVQVILRQKVYKSLGDGFPV